MKICEIERVNAPDYVTSGFIFYSIWVLYPHKKQWLAAHHHHSCPVHMTSWAPMKEDPSQPEIYMSWEQWAFDWADGYSVRHVFRVNINIWCSNTTSEYTVTRAYGVIFFLRSRIHTPGRYQGNQRENL